MFVPSSEKLIGVKGEYEYVMLIKKKKEVSLIHLTEEQ